MAAAGIRIGFFVGAFIMAAGVASGQPVPLEDRGPLLMSDQGAPPFDGIFIFRDLDGDGLALDPSEGGVWFDRTNAEGLLGETSNFTAIHATASGAVFAADVDSRAVYRLRDVNGDGDAQDAGESAIFFDASNMSGITIGVPSGLASDASGAVYLTLAGSVANNEPDAIVRLIDLNGDGDAQDSMEAVIWADLQAFKSGDSVPFEIIIREDGTALYIEFAGSPDTVRLLRDENNNGVIDANEQSIFIADGTFGVDFGFALAADSGVLVQTNSGSTQGLWRLTDLNESGSIDSEQEVAFLWSENQNADGLTIGTSFDLDAGSGGRVFLLDSGSNDHIIVLEDLNGDGDYLDAGETKIFAVGAVHNFDRPRSMTFLPNAESIAPLKDFEVTFGSLLSGTLAELIESDDAVVHTRSQFGFSAIEPNLLLLDVGATATSEVSTLNLTIESRINNPVGNATYALRRWTTNMFETVGMNPISNSESIHEIDGIPADGYIRANDQRVELRIKHVVVAVFSALGFDSFIDQVEIATFE